MKKIINSYSQIWSVGLVALVAIFAFAGAAHAQITKTRLSEIIPGTETTTLVPNGDFEDNSSGNGFQPAGWNRFGNMFYDEPSYTVPNNPTSQVANFHIDGGGVGNYTQTISNLFPNTEYVLSAYMWHLGNAASNQVGQVEIDLNDAAGEPNDGDGSISISQNDPLANDGYFVSGTFNTANTGTNVNLRIFMVHGGVTTGWPNQPDGGLWDNIAVTVATNFVAPQPSGVALTVINSFQAEDDFFTRATVFLNGSIVPLSWDTVDATSVEIDQGVGSVALSGSTTTTLANDDSDTIYTLTATGPSNVVEKSIALRSVAGDSVTHRYVRFAPLELRDNNSSIQLSEFVLLNGASAIIPVSATNEVGLSPGGEGPENLWDNTTGTKWLCSTTGDFGQAGLGCRVIFDLGSPTTFDGYYFATANDANGRDPLRWTLEGSDDGTNWVLVESTDVGFPFVTTDRQALSQEPVPLPGDSLVRIEDFAGDIAKILPGEPLVLTWQTKGAISVSIDQGIGAVAEVGSVTNFPVVDTTYTLSATRGAVTRTATVDVDVVTSTITNIAYANFNDAGDELFLIGDTPSPLPGLVPPAPLVGVDTNLSGDARLRLTYDQGGVGDPETAWFGFPVAIDVGFRTTFGLNMESYGANFVGGEGISFMVQNSPDGRAAVPTGGNTGNGEFLLASNALNIVFDSYQNAGDPSAAFVRVVAGDSAELAIADITAIPALTGFLGTDPTTNLTFIGFNSNQVPYAVEVIYSPGDLDLSINGVSVLENVSVDLGAIGALDGQGRSYVGFAGQTGGDSQNNDVTSWFLNRRPALEITDYSFNFATDQLTLTWGSSELSTYRITSSADLASGFPTVLASGIPGAAGLDETSTTVSFTEGTLGFIRVEEE